MAEFTGGVSYKTGIVHEVDDDACMARVRLDDLDELVTGWLHVGVKQSHENRDYWAPDVGEHVACLLDANFDEGVIICAIYSKNERPPVGTRDKRHVAFKDGTTIEYDRKEHVLKVHCVGDIKIISETHITMQAPRIDLN